jgi:ubiquinone/menaquinone biosynthesis C-methylase UbiE
VGSWASCRVRWPRNHPERRATIQSIVWRIDPEGVELRALARLAPVGGLRVLELGCGDGRLTFGLAPAAKSVLAVDPDVDRLATARASLPASLAEKIELVVAGATEVDSSRGEFDLALFSWSL